MIPLGVLLEDILGQYLRSVTQERYLEECLAEGLKVILLPLLDELSGDDFDGSVALQVIAVA